MPRQSVESDEELQAQEINSDEDLASNSVSRKRIQKPSTKQKEIDEGNLKAEMKKLEKMKKKVKNMKQQRRKDERASKKSHRNNEQMDIDEDASKKSQRHSDGSLSNEDACESEEDSNPNALGFSSSIQPLTIANANDSDMSKKFKTPLKKVRSSAARIPQAKLSANAFKVIPTTQNSQIRSHSANLNTDEVAENDQNTSDVLASKSRKCSHSELRSSSPVAHSLRSSSPVVTLQEKGKLRKRSHAEFRSSSPLAVAHSSSLVVRSSSPVAHSSSPVAHSSSPIIPMKKKAKTIPPHTLSARKAHPTIPVYREGAEVKHKKPKASDYEDIVQALILRAASQYEALVSTQDSFPDTTQRLKWARKSWSDANNDAGHEYELTDEISSLLRKRGSRIRGHALTVIRPLVMNTFGFKRGSDTRVISFNQSLCARLKAGSAFHYKDFKARTGFAQGGIISEILQAVWFENKTSLGVIFEKQFNPIAFETLALIFTVIDFCLDEWTSGTFNKATLWEKNIVARHEVFRADLINWGALNPPVVAAIRKKLYLRACRNAGVITEAKIKQNLVGEAMDRARAELDGRTGETDSEIEADEEPMEEENMTEI